jgi:hypothetical protein
MAVVVPNILFGSNAVGHIIGNLLASNKNRDILRLLCRCENVPAHVGFGVGIMFSICWIPHIYSVWYLLDSAHRFSSQSVGFRAEILFDICWIPHRNCLIRVGFYAETLIFLLDCVQKFFSISSAFHTEFLFDTCWIPYRNSVGICWIPHINSVLYTYVGFWAEVLFHIWWIPYRSSVWYMLDSVRKSSSISTGFRTEILFDIYWIPYRNSTQCPLHFTQKFCCISADFRTELVFWKNHQRVSP